jgi:hypothetical protein
MDEKCRRKKEGRKEDARFEAFQGREGGAGRGRGCHDGIGGIGGIGGGSHRVGGMSTHHWNLSEEDQVRSVPSWPIAARIPPPILRIHAMSPAVMTVPRLACGEGKACRNPRRSHTHTNHFHLAESINREDVQAAASSAECT